MDEHYEHEGHPLNKSIIRNILTNKQPPPKEWLSIDDLTEKTIQYHLDNGGEPPNIISPYLPKLLCRVCHQIRHKILLAKLTFFLYTILSIVCGEFEPRRMARSLLNRLESGTMQRLNYAILWSVDEMNKDWTNSKQSEFVVTNKRTDLKIIPYIGCKAGFNHIFNKIIPDTLACSIYDVFGGGGAFSFYACERFGSHRVTYNDNNPIVVNLIRQVQTSPSQLWDLYNEHYNNSSTEYYYQVRDLCLENGVEGAANFLYLAKNAFSGKIRFNASNKFNSPIRKGSSCPKVDRDSLLNLSNTIQDLTIMNKDYREFACVDNSFIYLDPPYFNNTNGHYNGVLDLGEFNQFLRTIEFTNKVVLSEQNHPDIFNLPESYTVRPITLRRSLQYFTQNKSEEMIAFNYQKDK